MSQAFIHLALFTAKALIITLLILVIFIAFFGLLARGRLKSKTRLCVKNLNKKYSEMADILQAETLPKKEFKRYLKDKKEHEENSAPARNIYVLNFHGDIRASATTHLCEEINTILNVAHENDEVILRLESAGGIVHGYGLAAAQLMRLRAHNVRLTVAIDKIAASGGYMMACIADKILAAPFSIIGSIGVIVQLPNFHRLLKDKDIDFEQQMAGEYKRTLSLFGENTDEGRKKLQEEIEDIHQQFKQLIKSYRPHIDINQVATGEHWSGQHALNLKLVDEVKTSDEYIFECSKTANLYEVCYEIKKSFFSHLTSGANAVKEKCLSFF